MNISIGQPELLEVVQRCYVLAKDNTAASKLKHMKLWVNSGFLFAEAANLNLSLKCRERLTKEYEFRDSNPFYIPAPKFYDIVSKLQEDKVVKLKLSEGGETLEISSGKSRFLLSVSNIVDFPKFPSSDRDFRVFCRLTLMKMLKGVFYAVSKDEARPMLNGVYWEISSRNEYGTRMVAADNHRLAIASAEWSRSGNNMDVLISRQMVGVLQKLLKECKDDKKDVKFKITENHLLFYIPETQVMVAGRLSQDGYPNYSEMTNRVTTKKAVVDSALLLAGLKRTVVLADKKAKMVKLEFKKSKPGTKLGKLIISNQGSDTDKAQDEINVIFDGDYFKIGVNAKYVIDAVSALGSTSSTLHMNEELLPLVVTSSMSNGGDRDSKYELKGIIMPMRLT